MKVTFKNIVFSVAMLPVAGFGLTSPVSQFQDWWSNFSKNQDLKKVQDLRIEGPKRDFSLNQDLKFLSFFPKSVLGVSNRIVYETDVFTESLFYISEQVQNLSDKNTG